MSSLNKVLIIGHLGKDPEVRFTSQGSPVATFSMAATEKWNNKDGSQGEHTEWFSVVAWNKLAEICQKYLAKGRQVYIEGRLRTREWIDKDGITRRTPEVIASQMVMLGSRQQSDPSPTPYAKAEDVAEHQDVITDDDIPF